MPRTKTTRNYSGSIFKRKISRDGKNLWVWDARKRYTDRSGKRREKFKRCFSQAEANVALINFQNEIAQILSGSAAQKPHSFFDLTNYFRKEYLVKAKVVDGRIIEGYRQDIKRLDNQIKDFEKFFGDILLSELNYEIIRKYKIKTATSPQKHRYINTPPKMPTVNRKLAMLRRILNVGVQLGWIINNPFNAGKPLIETRAENRRTRILTFEEEAALLEECRKDVVIETTRYDKPLTITLDAPHAHIYLILVIALDTAMRKGEIFALRRNQIDLANLTITLEAAQTKSFKERIIPITDRLKNLLEKRFDDFPVKDDEFIFGGVKDCRRAFRAVLAAAKVEDVVFHSLRHTAITWMDLAGVSEMVKKNIVGHSSGDVHFGYHNMSFDVLEDARGKMNEFRRKVDESLHVKKSEKAA